MVGNWILTAWRHLMRHRLYTAINVLGLAVGMAVCMIIATLVRFETSFDGYHRQADRIVRVNRTDQISGMPPWRGSATGLPVGPALLEHLPGVEEMVRVDRFQAMIDRDDGQQFVENAVRVDPSYPRLFDLDFRRGDPTLALARPGDTVITETAARKFFGEADPMGRTLKLKSGRLLTVTGVIADPPRNSSLRATVLTNIATSTSDQGDRDYRERQQSWHNSWLTTYLLLSPGIDPADMEKRIQAALPSIVPDYVVPEEAKGRFSFSLNLQRLTDIRMHPIGGEAGVPVAMVQALALIGTLVLLIAGINFVNLTTARSALRLREIGIRKTLGAGRFALIMQFLTESMLLAMLAGLLALPAMELVLPLLSRLDVDVPGDPFADPVLLLGLALFPPLLGLAAGLYPAIVLSRVAPAMGARGQMAGGGRLRAALVVLQFSIAVALTIGALVVFLQTRHAATQQLGFDRENVLLIHDDREGAAAPLDRMRDAMLRLPGVRSAALAAWAPADGSVGVSELRLPGQGTPTHLRVEPVDFGYLETLGATLLAGRLFDPAHSNDITRLVTDRANRPAANIVITRAMLPKLGVQDPVAALGLQIRGSVSKNGGTEEVLTIVGVVADIRFSTAHFEPDAVLFTIDQSQRGVLIVRLVPGDQKAMLAMIDRKWAKMVPDKPIRRSFLDENIDRLYEVEKRQGTVIAVFAGLAGVIACLGLYGLAAFTAERRTKEIGIRKVLGASVADIARLLVWQFSRPVLIANLIACPLTWIALHHWLEGFAFRIALSPLLFAAVGLGALMIAWVTVAGHAVRVAAEKPVNALRYE